MAILRSRKTVEFVNQESITAAILGAFSNNDLIKANLAGVFNEKIFSDYSALIIKNDTDINFVLPESSFYYAKKNKL